MKLIVLDRDGVVNQDSDSFVKSAEEWIPIPGSLEAICRLCHNGYRVVLASNQSGLGRGLFTIDDLNDMHRKMQRELVQMGGQIEAVFFCPHAPEDRCRCRKPLPGLFEQVRHRFQLDMGSVPAVGDSLRDIQAAREAGALPILVLTGKGKRTLASHPEEIKGVPLFSDLHAVADSLLASAS
jgi:D-glycero-D-manno-heptose 1,7-bisphosphate phosphatase